MMVMSSGVSISHERMAGISERTVVPKKRCWCCLKPSVRIT